MTTLISALESDTLTLPSPSGLYVYAIIATPDRLIFDLPGAAEADVYTINSGALAAVVGPAERASYQRLERAEAIAYLQAHQQVVETVQRDFPALPVKFGTVLPDEARVLTMLAQGAAQFQSALERVRGQQQIEVVVLWDPAQVFARIAAEPEIETLKAQIIALPPAESEAARVAFGQTVKASFDRRRAELHEHLRAALRPLTEQMILNPLMDDRMVLNVALLLDADGRAALDRTLDALDERFSGDAADELPLHFRAVGPLPPYSFASVMIALPDADQLDAARQMLGLPLATSADAIRQAYRTLAGRLHPDHNPDDADAEARMAALTAAARLLTAYAQQSHGGRVDLRRESIAQALLISVAE